MEVVYQRDMVSLCVMLIGAILSKPITHATKVDTVYSCWKLHQSSR